MRMRWFCDIRVKNMRSTNLETGEYLMCSMILATQCICTKLVL